MLFTFQTINFFSFASPFPVHCLRHFCRQLAIFKPFISPKPLTRLPPGTFIHCGVVSAIHIWKPNSVCKLQIAPRVVLTTQQQNIEHSRDSQPRNTICFHVPKKLHKTNRKQCLIAFLSSAQYSHLKTPWRNAKFLGFSFNAHASRITPLWVTNIARCTLSRHSLSAWCRSCECKKERMLVGSSCSATIPVVDFEPPTWSPTCHTDFKKIQLGTLRPLDICAKSKVKLLFTTARFHACLVTNEEHCTWVEIRRAQDKMERTQHQISLLQAATFSVQICAIEGVIIYD